MTEQRLMILVGRDYVDVAKMRAAAQVARGEERVRLEWSALLRIDLARQEVKRSGLGDVWARTDAAAWRGQVRLTHGLAKDAVHKIKEETK
ncbi:hypothetical protein BJF89_01170 [Corynebacterium sp. CNJ-954]|uniref:hypothetical protein n=1 Tax=Corynebacterium sp. CNJ-954 TaxID=1904962 RepID=UPI00095DE7CB|nr:hypothetical protein [Corynebacterium sp. CNJ-954]OLT54873.1 hypothetical protein BJF89_01170 [Corynebacterium sp. CNJ-954]